MCIKTLDVKGMTIDVYRKLQEHFDTFPMRFPPTETGVEIRLLKKLFTPEEAEIALVLICGYPGLMDAAETVEVIYERVKDLGYSKEEVEQHLDNMAKNGAIMGITKDGKKIYTNTILIVGIYEYQVDKLTEEFQKDLDQYIAEAWGPANRNIRVNQLRTIPVGIKIEHENPIINYDDIKIQFDKSDGPFAKFNCVCRQSKDLKNEPCEATDRREVCLNMGEMAQMYIEQGYGKEITKVEALEYLKKNEEEGLIFQLGNAQEMVFVCSCCTCCCEGLAGLKQIPNPADYASSNYLATINEELCSGCGSCVDRCQMDAITLECDYAVIAQKRCIGCGNCLIVCPEDAITLIVKDNPRVPPFTSSDLFSKIAEERRKSEAKSAEK
jgi:electron transport complex protein RnfB